MKSPIKILDILGIGFGPANIALAIALEELAPELTAHFLETRPSPLWQPNMLLPGSDIQNHPLRDLVTPRNPRSRYSFTNFLFENQRLYEHLNLPLHYPLRLEYAQYVTWAANFFNEQVTYNCEALSIETVETSGDADKIQYFKVQAANGQLYYASSLVLAPGRTPNIPSPFAGLVDNRIHHLNQYLPALKKSIERTDGKCRMAVIGGSQSAVEIMLHASDQVGVKEIVGYTRNFGYRQKDTSPFSEEVYFPEFVDKFYSASPEQKKWLRKELIHTNYSASDSDVLHRLYIKQYEQRLNKNINVTLNTCHIIINCAPQSDGIILKSCDALEGHTLTKKFDLVILATGFINLGLGDQEELCPPLLASMIANKDQPLAIQIARDYRINLNGTLPAYLNGLCESSHGMGDAGSFSLLALRSKTIVNSLRVQLLNRHGHEIPAELH